MRSHLVTLAVFVFAVSAISRSADAPDPASAFLMVAVGGWAGLLFIVRMKGGDDPR